MATKTRIANKTQWALDDILEECEFSTKHWQRAMAQAEKKMDPVMMQSLGRLRDNLARIERKARQARQGDYSDD